MAHWQLAGDLHGSPLGPQQRTGSNFHPGRKRAEVKARFRASAGEFKGLFGYKGSTTPVATQFETNRGLVAFKQSADERDVELGFLNAVNLISLNLAEVFLTHRATRLAGLATLNAKHPQPLRYG